MKTLMPKTLLAAMALAFAGTAAAVPLSAGLVDGFNTIEDQDREAFIDANGDGVLSIGDVFIGFVRFDDFLPASISTGNHLYGVISNQIVGGSGTNIILGATTVAGLTLADLTGDPNVGAGDMFAVYDRATPYGTNLIHDAGAVATNVFEVIDYIVTGGTLRLTAGIYDTEDWFFVSNAVSGFGLGTPVSLLNVPASITVGSFTGGVSVNYNNTNYIFNDSVLGLNPLLSRPVTNQIGIGNGAIRGAIGDGQEGVFGNAPGWNQCMNAVGGAISCGYVTDADYFVNVTRVPEPATLGLLGLGLLGLGIARRRAGQA